MKFDCIVGNPPYSTDAGNNKSKKIWIDFLEKSLNLIKENGTVSLIIPTNFLLPKHKSFKLIKKIAIPYKAAYESF